MIWWCVLLCVFSTLCLQVGNRLGFWGGFSCFVSFIWCQLFACLIKAAIFLFQCHQHLWFGLSFFATGICGMFFLSLSQVFVVCSFFLCHRHLCTVSFFHSLFYHRHSCYTFCLCLVSTCFRVSVYLSVFGIMLCACHLSASSLEIQTGIFSKSITLWTALQIPLWSKPHLVFRHKVYEIALSEVLATQMGVTEAQRQSQLIWIVQIWPIFASQWVDSVGTHA